MSKKDKKEEFKSELDKLSCLSKYPVKMLNEFKIQYIPNIKGWYKMNKGRKVELLKEALKNNCDELPEVPKRITREKQYGVKYGKVQAYNEEEQKKFIDEGYNTSHPLEQKKLDELKHKDAYKKKKKIVLNKHQKDFVINFINSYFTGALLFHGVGSGKTLTSVVFSHYYLSLYPKNNVCIITPPSLLFNFVDVMRLFGLDVKDNRYKFETYDKFIKNYKKIVNDKTLLIIDESHILRTPITYGTKHDDITDEPIEILKTGRKAKEIIDAANLAKKLLCMTGTAFVNHLYDIENTMTIIGQRAEPLSVASFNNVVQNPELRYDYFKYKISYFSVFDNPDLEKEFPNRNEIYVGIELKTPYKNIMESIIKGDNPYTEEGKFEKLKEIYYDKNGNLKTEYIEMPDPKTYYNKLGFNILQSLDKEKAKKGEKEKVLSEGAQLAAFFVAQRQYGNIIDGLKINFIIDKLTKNPNMKSIIYSSFYASSLVPLIKNLRENNIKYATITGNDSVTKREKSKKDYNNIDSGVNVLIISKAGTEGVDTKNTQQFFLFEPQWNEATAEQAIARAVRFKSHIELPPNQRFVNIYRLIIYLPKDKEIVKSIIDGSYEGRLAKYFKAEKEKDEILKKIIMLVNQKNSKYTIDDTYFRTWEERYRVQERASYKRFRPGIGQKKPSYNEYKKSGSELHYYYYDYLINNEEEFSKFKKKWDKANEGTEDKLWGTSADVILQTNSFRKKYQISNFINILKNDIPKVKDFSEPYHKELLKALDNEKDPKKIIEKQQIILEQHSNKVIKKTERLEELIGKSIMDSKLEKQRKKEKFKEIGLQEYFTPSEIADELLSYSHNIKWTKPSIRVLEPTAGWGALVAATLKARGDKEIFIDMIELSEKNRNYLINNVVKQPTINLMETKDFMKFEASNSYHLIVMNPPFNPKGSKFKYMDFVMKAYYMLEQGGELLAIVPTTELSSKDKNLQTFIKNNVQVLKKYKKYKWQGEDKKKIYLNFELIKLESPLLF